MFHPIWIEQVIYTPVSKTVTWKFERDNLLAEIRSCEVVKVPLIEHAVFDLDSFDVCVWGELAKLAVKLIFLTFIKQNIHIDDEFFAASVMSQNFFKEIIFVLLEED